MNNIKDREFDYLRREIDSYISKIDFMNKVLYISITAILAWAINTNNPIICLLPYCIIIPSFLVVQSYNESLLKIGMYFYVFYDDYKWEKRSHKFNKIPNNPIRLLWIYYKLPYIFVGVLSSLLSWAMLAFNEKNLSNVLFWITNICCSIITLLFIIILFIQKNNNEIRDIYIKKWEEVREKEQEGEGTEQNDILQNN